MYLLTGFDYKYTRGLMVSDYFPIHLLFEIVFTKNMNGNLISYIQIRYYVNVYYVSYRFTCTYVRTGLRIINLQRLF